MKLLTVLGSFKFQIIYQIKKRKIPIFQNEIRLPPGLLAQVVPSHASDFHLCGSSPSINTYPAVENWESHLKNTNNLGDEVVNAWI